jgi:hypothetical protein
VTDNSYASSEAYLQMIRRRREAASRLGVTPEIRNAIRKPVKLSKRVADEMCFVDRPADPYGNRVSTKGPQSN